MDPGRFLDWSRADQRLRVAAAGSWTAANADRIEPLLDDVARQPAATMTVDTSGVQELDVYGAWLLERLIREARDRGQEAHLLGLADSYRGLFEEVRHVNQLVPPHRRHRRGVLSGLDSLGRRGIEAGRGFGILLATLGALAIAAGRVVLRPRTLRLTAIVHQLDRVGLQAVPIILLITVLMGSIIAQQGIFHFRRFGAEEYVVDLVAILTLREIGVVIVAIMVAGRSGSSYTAELGSMTMREEIDALRTMGLDPVEVLVLPRVIALVLALPVLTFLGSIAALYGGGLVAWLYAGMHPAIFLARLRDAASVTDFQVGMIKAPFMALAIGAIACGEGFRVKGSTESLGFQTTTSVVKSIFTVIVLDGLFAMFFASVGM